MTQPGTPHMPAWEKGELPPAPVWSGRNWSSMIGPGLLCAGAAIGGGEWLLGPINTARYGGCILWVTTLSILAQVVYNVEISRYTLYTGEPIMNGKFRLLPHPLFWLGLYLVLDFGSLIPYQTAGAASPAVALVQGEMPRPGSIPADRTLVLSAGALLYILVAIPLAFSGKVYSFVKGLMGIKIVVVFAFLSFMTLAYCSAETWIDVGTGFFKIGTVPVPGDRTVNVFGSLARGEGFPAMDPTAFAALAAYAAIAGIGGMKNSMVSNYTREQGWGMGAQVGAIPSMFRGLKLELSHVGKVFEPTADSMERWRGWMRHVRREQWILWMAGAMIGVALPAMLSVQFLPRGAGGDNWAMAAMTAAGVKEHVGGALGSFYWYALIGCGLLVLLPNTVSDADSTVRRWVDLSWSAVPALRRWEPRSINRFYFWSLVFYVGGGVLILLLLAEPKNLLLIYGCIANFALGFSCLHVLAVNLSLLPPALRPGWASRLGLVLSAVYFFALAGITLYFAMPKLAA